MNFSKTFRTILAGLMLIAVPAQICAMQPPAQPAQAAQQDENLSGWFGRIFGNKDAQTKLLMVGVVLMGLSLAGTTFFTDLFKDTFANIFRRGKVEAGRRANEALFGNFDQLGADLENNNNNGGNVPRGRQHPVNVF